MKAPPLKMKHYTADIIINCERTKETLFQIIVRAHRGYISILNESKLFLHVLAL